MSARYQQVSSFDAKLRLPAFRKDEMTEKFLARLNGDIAETQRWLEKSLPPAKHPIVLLLGTQRSGSTLLCQLMGSRLDVGYCSNLMARFPGAPAVGASLQEQIVGTRYHACRDYRSQHGVTALVEEPHEFGYFWARHLGVAGDVHEPSAAQLRHVNIALLRREMDSVVRVFRKPVVLKCLLGSFFIPLLARLPFVFFVDLQRDLVATAASVLKARQDRFGSDTVWWSFRTRNFAALARCSPEVQVANQLVRMRGAIDAAWPAVPANRKLVLRYEELIRNPERELERLRVALGHFMPPPARVGDAIPASATRVQAIRIPAALRRRIESGLAVAHAEGRP